MTTTFMQAVQALADEIIAISLTLQNRMTTWADVVSRNPDSPNAGKTVGYITDWRQPNAIEVLVEVQAVPDVTTGLIRTQVIETVKDESGNERFNQVSLHFTVNYDQARPLVEQGSATARDHIAALLHDSTSTPSRIIISIGTGKDPVTDELLGVRYEYDESGLAGLTKKTEQEVLRAAGSTLEALKVSATREAGVTA